MKKRLRQVGEKAYAPDFQREVEIVYANALENGNVYMVCFKEANADAKGETITEVFYEKIFENHLFEDELIFNSKTSYEGFQKKKIEQAKQWLLNEDLWIKQLWAAFLEQSNLAHFNTAMAKILEEKLKWKA